jgi:surface protein
MTSGDVDHLAITLLKGDSVMRIIPRRANNAIVLIGLILLLGVVTNTAAATGDQFPQMLPPNQWNPLNGPTGTGMDDHVLALTTDSASNLYAGGEFLNAGGVIANHVAKWDGVQWSALGTGINGYVWALATDNAGNLYAGGSFFTAGSVNVNGVAKWDGIQWSALGTGMNGAVRALVIDSAGNLYAGGHFTTAGGVPANRVARWDGTQWVALGAGANSPVYALETDSAGNLYAGGWFTTAGGVTANHVARWDGTQWSALGTGTDAYGYIYALATDNAGNLYAGGQFITAGGVTANRVAKWDGIHWTALETGMNGNVRALVMDGAGKLYAGGEFSTAGGVTVNRVARWDGTQWTALGTGVNDHVFALAIDDAGNLYAGGGFPSAGWATVNYVASYGPAPEPPSPDDFVITVKTDNPGTSSSAQFTIPTYSGNDFILGKALFSISSIAGPAMTLGGNADITINGAGVFSNSVSDPSINFSGTAVITIEYEVTTAGSIDVDGGPTINAGSFVEYAPQIYFTQIDEPDCTGLPVNPSPLIDGSNVNFQSGIYTSQLSFTNAVTNYIFEPGLYCLDGGLQMTNGSILGDGVTFFMRNDSEFIIYGGNINLTAPKNDQWADGSGSYWNGMLIFYDYLSIHHLSVAGNWGSYLEGTVYNFGGNCQYNGAGDSVPIDLQFVCDTIELSGGSGILINYTPANHYSSFSIETYTYNVDCNDDGTDEATGVTGDYTCDYSALGGAGTYTIRITDNTIDGSGFPRIYFNNTGDKDKLLSIDQWGGGKWTSMGNAFYGCTNLVSSAGDTPDLSGLTDLSSMFQGAVNFNGDISGWNTSSVTDMSGMFMNASNFNRDISGWDVGALALADSMFSGAGLSTDNYDALLIGWDAQLLQSDVDFDGGLSTYCAGEAARANMISSDGWSITDGGLDCPVLFSDGFETGDFSQWSRVNLGSGFLTVCAEAAMNGSWGACVDRGTNDNRKVLIDDTPVDQTSFSVRFNMDINSFSMPEGTRFRFLEAKQGLPRAFFLVLRRMNGQYQIQFNLLVDGQIKSKSAWYALSDTPHTLEIDWQAASADGANDGYIQLYMDGALLEEMTALDNDTHIVSSLRIGFIGRLDGSPVSGIWYVDDVTTGNNGYLGLP